MQNFEYQYKFFPCKVCLDDQHSSLYAVEPCISVFLIIKYNIDSNFCLYRITI